MGGRPRFCSQPDLHLGTCMLALMLFHRECVCGRMFQKCFLWAHEEQHLLCSVAVCCSLECQPAGLFPGAEFWVRSHHTWAAQGKRSLAQLVEEEATLTCIVYLHSVVCSSWFSIRTGAMRDPSSKAPGPTCSASHMPQPWHLHCVLCLQLSRASGQGMEPFGVWALLPWPP